MMKFTKRWLNVGIISLLLNLFWEFSHHSLYIDLTELPKHTHLVIASVIDMIIVIVIFAIIVWKNKNFKWIDKPSKFDYLFVVIMSLIAAILIETTNLNLGRWQYTTSMPLIFGIGISPLIQLAMTGVVTMVILRYLR